MAICVHAYPQTSVKDVAALSDYNTYTPEDGSGQEACGYWKYTSQEDELVKIIMTANGTASFFELDEADEQKKIYAASTFDESYIYTYYVPVLKNHTVYFKVTAYDTGTASFYAEMEKNRNIGKTSSKDSPLPITDGEPLLLGDMYQNDWGERAYYVTYTATETGKLNIRSNQSITSASVNGTVINFAYSDNSYTSGFNVDAGEKYEIELKSYSNLMLTAELSHRTGFIRHAFHTGRGNKQRTCSRRRILVHIQPDRNTGIRQNLKQQHSAGRRSENLPKRV